MKQSAVILGGGIAGLAAARELARAGVTVTVLEAQPRAGGRIRTIHPGRFPVELGAEFVHGESQPLLKVIREAGLPTQPVSDRNRVCLNGRLEDVPIWEEAGRIFTQVNPDGPDLTFDEFLATQAGLEERVRQTTRHFVEGFNAARADHISAQALRRAQEAADQMQGGQEMRVTPGYAALVDFLLAEIRGPGGKLLTDAQARGITWSHGHAAVSFERNNAMETLAANAAIVALPLGILKTDAVFFEPEIPDKLAAVRGLEFGNVVRIVFQFREAFWDELGFVHLLDAALPTWWHDPRGPLLIGWAGGPHADALRNTGPRQLENIGLEILGRIFAERPEWLRRQLVTSHYCNWGADPFTRGAYSYIPKGGLELPRQLAAPVDGTLFFAGEATVTDAQMGTVFGAFESGLRAAREFLAA